MPSVAVCLYVEVCGRAMSSSLLAFCRIVLAALLWTDCPIPAKQENNLDLPTQSEPEHENNSTIQEQQEPNTVPFPTVPEDQNQEENKTKSEQLGHGKHVQPKPKGMYKKMHGGLVAASAHAESLDDDNLAIELPEDDEDNQTDLPPDFALIGGMDSEPPSIDEALRGPDAQKWREALDYEIRQLEKMGTWVVEDLPQGYTAIPCGVVLKHKRGPDGEIQSYRVWIVAGGHRQVQGLNYSKTFSAAAKMPTVRAVLANAAEQDWEIKHVDVKSAYLNAPLEETVYMKPPQGVLKPGLLKGLYGLKQAGRAHMIFTV